MCAFMLMSLPPAYARADEVGSIHTDNDSHISPVEPNRSDDAVSNEEPSLSVPDENEGLANSAVREVGETYGAEGTNNTSLTSEAEPYGDGAATNVDAPDEASADVVETEDIVGLSDDRVADEHETPAPEQPAEATYVLRSVGTDTQVLDVRGGASAGQLITYGSNSGINQRFVLSRDDDGTCRLVSASDGRSIGSLGTSGEQVLLSDDMHEWIFERQDTGWLIRSAHTGLYLSATNNAKNSASVTMRERETDGNASLATMLWELVPAPSLTASDQLPSEGLYWISNKAGKQWDVRGAKDVAGTQVVTYTPSANPNQLFYIEHVNGFVRIHAGETRMTISSESDIFSGGAQAALRSTSAMSLNQLYRTSQDESGYWTFTDLATGNVLGLKGSFITSGAPTAWRLAPAHDMIKAGLFDIRMIASADRRLDVRGASLDDSASIIQWDASGAQNQKWDIVRLGRNEYTVQNVRSGRYLSINSAGYAVQSKEAQSFEVVPLINGWGLRLLGDGRVLAIEGASDKNRAAALFATMDGSKGQRFVFKATNPLASGVYAIELTGNRNLVVAISSETFAQKANAQLAKWTGAQKASAGNQKWVFTLNSDGTYTITNAYSQLVLDAAGTKPKNGANVTQWKDNGSANQHWKLVYNHDGSFSIVNAANPQVVLNAASSSSGKNVNVAPDEARATQRMAFKPCSYAYPSISGDNELDGIIREMVARYGNDESGLWKAYCTIGAMPYTKMNEYPPGSWKTWSVSYAKQMYHNGTGNCYRYASLLCWYARGIGYDARTVSGQIVLGGRWVAHGWIELKKGGKTYVVDCRLGNYRNRTLGESLKTCYMVSYAAYPYQARVVTYA